jgi:hypothetical protein
MSDMRPSCRDANKQAPKIKRSHATEGPAWLRHDKQKHIGHRRLTTTI